VTFFVTKVHEAPFFNKKTALQKRCNLQTAVFQRKVWSDFTQIEKEED